MAHIETIQSATNLGGEELLTTKELAKFLKVDDRTPESWRMRGVGPKFIRVGGLPRYRPSDVREYLDANTAISTSQESAHAAESQVA